MPQVSPGHSSSGPAPLAERIDLAIDAIARRARQATSWRAMESVLADGAALTGAAQAFVSQQTTAGTRVVVAHPRNEIFPPTVVATGTPVDRPTWRTINDADLLVTPIDVDGQRWGEIVFSFRDRNRKERPLVESLTTALGEITEQLLVRLDRRRLQSELALASAHEQIAIDMQRSMDCGEIAQIVVNDGQRLLGARRVAVLIRRRNRLRLAAATGVRQLRRSDALTHRLEQLAEALCPLRQQIELGRTGDSRDLAPAVVDAWQAFQDVAGDRSLIFIPLYFATTDQSATRQVCGAIAASFDTEPSSTCSTAPTSTVGGNTKDSNRMAIASQLAQHAELAIGRSMTLGPLKGLLPLMASTPGNVPLWRRLLPPLIAGIVATTLLAIPREFEIVAEGSLQPRQMHHVYAPHDGVIEDLALHHGQQVTAGDSLLTVRSHYLELEEQRVSGELQKTTEELHALEANRLRLLDTYAAHDAAHDTSRSGLAAKARELKERIANLTAQGAILARQQSASHLVSPINGSILTWQAERILPARPVRRGQQLVTIGNVTGDWQLELRIADHDVGHILRAKQSDSQTPLSVRFSLASSPGTEYRGWLESIADCNTAAGEESWVEATAHPATSLAGARPDGPVRARIACGRRPIGYIWLRPIFEAWRYRFF